MQAADQHTRTSLGFSILPKDTLTCRPGESNQQLFNNLFAGSTPEPQPPSSIKVQEQIKKLCFVLIYST